MIIGLVIIVLILVGYSWMNRETQEEYDTRIALEEEQARIKDTIDNAIQYESADNKENQGDSIAEITTPTGAMSTGTSVAMNSNTFSDSVSIVLYRPRFQSILNQTASGSSKSTIQWLTQYN